MPNVYRFNRSRNRGNQLTKGADLMRYSKGKYIVTGNPSIAWIEKMTKYGLVFTCDNGRVIAEFVRC